MQYLVSLVMIALLSVNAAYADDGSIIHLGPILKETIQYIAVAFGTAFAAVATAAVYKMFSYFGIQTTEMQRGQLQAIIVNGINDAAVKAEAAVAANPRLDIDVKDRIVADAVVYAQSHGAATIKALGLDPQSGEAVDAIRARIATAIADPATPTPAVLNGAQPLAPK